MPSKYDSLGQWLRNQSDGESSSLSFSEVERLIGAKLPLSARQHRAWWSNGLGQPQGRVWRQAGWRVAEVRFSSEQVTFEHIAPSAGTRAIEPGDSQVERHRLGIAESPSGPPDLPSDWFWEGNVQRVIAAHLGREGWQVVSQADTATHERGIGVLARNGGRTLAVEVKGYPSENYRDPTKRNLVKRTQPSTQMKHWFAEALHSIVVRGGVYPEHERALAFPDVPRVRGLVASSRWALDRLGIAVLLVNSEGHVTRL